MEYDVYNIDTTSNEHNLLIPFKTHREKKYKLRTHNNTMMRICIRLAYAPYAHTQTARIRRVSHLWLKVYHYRQRRQHHQRNQQ